MKKALLILFGGRVIPNVLTILYLKPQIIVPIVSEDELKRLDDFIKGVNDLLLEEGHRCEWLNYKRGESFVIKAHNKEDIKAMCENVVHNTKYKDEEDNLKDYQWTFNITSGTSIMSIAAYEAAKELKEQEKKPVSCWYLNTARRKVEVLVADPENIPRDEDLFRISIKQYAAIHNKELTIRLHEDTLPSEAKRIEFANFLLQNRPYIQVLNNLLMKKDDDTSVQNQISVQNEMSRKNNVPKPKYYSCVRPSPLKSDEKEVLRQAEACALIRNLVKSSSGWSFEITNQQNAFLKGGWLELYVCNEIANIKERENDQLLFQDVGRNRHVYIKRGQGHNPQEENELDVSMIYNAQLFIVECKAGFTEVKRSEAIFKLDSVANAFGGGFVGKYLVTALPKDEVIELKKDRPQEGNDSDPEKSNMEERLDIRKIRLITWEDLKKLKAIFREEAENPQFPRM